MKQALRGAHRPESGTSQFRLTSGSTERRRSRTYPAWGYQTSPVLKCARLVLASAWTCSGSTGNSCKASTIVMSGGGAYQHTARRWFANGLQPVPSCVRGNPDLTAKDRAPAPAQSSASTVTAAYTGRVSSCSTVAELKLTAPWSSHVRLLPPPCVERAPARDRPRSANSYRRPQRDMPPPDRTNVLRVPLVGRFNGQF